MLRQRVINKIQSTESWIGDTGVSLRYDSTTVLKKRRQCLIIGTEGSVQLGNFNTSVNRNSIKSFWGVGQITLETGQGPHG